MRNAEINKQAMLRIARALGGLNREVVYVGGAVVGCYINDTAAEDMRPTKDIDLTFKVITAGDLERLRQELVARGFTQRAEDQVICRFRYEDLMVDVMSTHPIGWAPSNRWFAAGFTQSVAYSLGAETIRLLPLAYFLATKLEAFFDRGIRDKYVSADLEDIVYLFNYTFDIAERVTSTDKELTAYLGDRLRAIRNDASMTGAISGHLFYEEVDERLEIVLQRIDAVIEWS